MGDYEGRLCAFGTALCGNETAAWGAAVGLPPSLKDKV